MIIGSLLLYANGTGTEKEIKQTRALGWVQGSTHSVLYSIFGAPSSEWLNGILNPLVKQRGEGAFRFLQCNERSDQANSMKKIGVINGDCIP